jgi:hypothetical protein
MSINRRHMLTGLVATVPATALASSADAANIDAELFRLEAEFNKADVLWQAASERTDETDWKNQSRKMLRAAMAEVDQKCAVVAAIAHRIMDIRACTLAGILLKLRVGHAWSMDEDWGQDEENVVRASIKADLEALAEKAGASLAWQ